MVPLRRPTDLQPCLSCLILCSRAQDTTTDCLSSSALYLCPFLYLLQIPVVHALLPTIALPLWSLHMYSSTQTPGLQMRPFHLQMEGYLLLKFSVSLLSSKQCPGPFPQIARPQIFWLSLPSLTSSLQCLQGFRYPTTSFPKHSCHVPVLLFFDDCFLSHVPLYILSS